MGFTYDFHANRWRTCSFTSYFPGVQGTLVAWSVFLIATLILLNTAFVAFYTNTYIFCKSTYNPSYFISFSQQLTSTVLEYLHAQYIQCKKKKKSWSPLPNLFHRVTGNPKHTIIFLCMYLLSHVCIKNIFVIFIRPHKFCCGGIMLLVCRQNGFQSGQTKDYKIGMYCFSTIKACK
jgi:hypothetical protein